MCLTFIFLLFWSMWGSVIAWILRRQQYQILDGRLSLSGPAAYPQCGCGTSSIIKHHVSPLASTVILGKACVQHALHCNLQMFVEVETSSISMAQCQLAVAVCMTSTGRTGWRGVKVQWRREFPLILVYCRCVLVRDKVTFGIKSQQDLLQEAGRSFASTVPSFPDPGIQCV